jgi:hypothetical protein
MDVHNIQRRLGVNHPRAVAKAGELVRLASMKLAGQLGQVWEQTLVALGRVWCFFDHCAYVLLRGRPFQGEICKQAVCFELACQS